MLSVFDWFVLLLQCNAFVEIVLSDEPMHNQGRGLVYSKLVEAHPPPHPSNFIADRPKAALLFWFFGDFRCGMLLFIVILVIYIYGLFSVKTGLKTLRNNCVVYV